MRTVVIGASGRMGRHAVADLRARGEAVVATSSRPGVAGTIHVPLDAAEELVRLIRPGDVLVVLAGATPTRPLEGMQRNVVAASTAVAAGMAAGAARIVLASSAAVYGDARDVALRESDELAPQSEYARSKVAAEIALDEFPGETVALRIFNVYGPGYDESLVAKVMTSSGVNGGLETSGSDDFVRDYVHLQTVAEAFSAARTAPLPTRHAIVNVGSGVRMSTRALVAEIARTRAVDVRFGPGPRTSSWADVGAMTRVLGVRPQPLTTFLTADSATISHHTRRGGLPDGH